MLGVCMIFAAIGIETNFSAIDWCIVAVYLLGTAVIGLCVNRFVKSVGDYIVAGRAIKPYLGIATMIGTELGLVTVMYAAQKGFTGGFSAFHIALVAAIVTLAVGLSGFIVVPLRQMGVMTIPEFYEKRFGRGVRVFGGAILVASGVLNMGLFLKAGSIFVTGITGMTSPLALKLVLSGLLGLVLIYTVLGGMISVIVTDYVQFVVLSFGLIVSCIFAVNKLGWQTIIDTVTAQHGPAGLNPFHSDGFGIQYVIWMAFLGLVSCAIWQTAVVRACSAENPKVVKRMYSFSSVGFMVRFLVPNFLGICALVYICQTPALQSIFLPDDGNADSGMTLMAMPVFIGNILPTGILGIITAGMLAAFMSTHDSYLLCWSSVLTQDVIAPCFKDGLSNKTRLRLTRTFVVLIGLFLLLWGLWYPLGQDLWDYMAITGAVYSTGAFALLVFGIYWKRASSTGAYLALCSGGLAALGLKPIAELFNLNASAETVGLATIGLAVVTMVLGSLAMPNTRPAASEEN